MAVVFGRSSRGQKTLIYRNFEYLKDCDNVCGTVSWRCRMYQRFKCKARLITNGDRVVSNRQSEHTHEGNEATALARSAVGAMKDAMGGLTVTPSLSQATVGAGLDNNVLMALPKRASLSRTLQRHRHKVVVTGNNGNPLPAVPTDRSFPIPPDFQGMVLFDSGPGDDRLIIMGCVELLDGLARADVWLADGTFKVVPTIFFQLYSIHFNFGSGINPAAVYCLLTNKSVDTYNRVLTELKRMIPAANPTRILVDFERATMNAFGLAYPNATIAGCYFHLCQSVIRKINEVGLKEQYESNDDIRLYVRCLPALAFVPADDVVEAFELLSETQPVDVDHLDEITSFFEHTYVRGRRQRGRAENYGDPMFPVDIWNHHEAGSEGMARTTNSVEGWHHGLQSLFLSHHPTVWNFMSGLKTDMNKQKAAFLQGTTGVENPSSKRYRKLNERVKRAVGSYGRAEVLTYLRAIAHLSHS